MNLYKRLFIIKFVPPSLVSTTVTPCHRIINNGHIISNEVFRFDGVERGRKTLHGVNEKMNEMIRADTTL